MKQIIFALAIIIIILPVLAASEEPVRLESENVAHQIRKSSDGTLILPQIPISCKPEIEGAMRYNRYKRRPEFCNGYEWLDWVVQK
jgi:hypothetical protein